MRWGSWQFLSLLHSFAITVIALVTLSYCTVHVRERLRNDELLAAKKEEESKVAREKMREEQRRRREAVSKA